MKITIEGTRAEIHRIQTRPIIAAGGAEPCQPVLAYRLDGVRVYRHPYSSTYRLLADLIDHSGIDDREAM
ncbi:hypothetical protein HS041_04270 [Planomonospora sp. ID67723]|uniref:hypothetical protein n=1 Tax=Planomonospora sp. ID67723 TaxID=2738134 RepID=UPI0018C376ED|nr:hypothetical protein [Planomonospora sp. ID67723]MBG0826985.1 hypothetical protein [Planomonospora sp. ID67723]